MKASCACAHGAFMCKAQLLLNELNYRKMFYHNFENVEAEPLLKLQCDLYSSSFVSKGMRQDTLKVFTIKR